MKTLLIFVIVVYYQIQCYGCDNFEDNLGHIKPSASSNVQAKAVADLIKRIIPERYREFLIIIDEDFKETSKDTFNVENINGTVKITGTTGVAAATGFNYFLKYFCNCHISWELSQLNFPEVLPQVNVTISLNDRFRYYLNVCTTSYSFVWWSWRQWEKHIDWIALNSFNLVLAFNGQEAIWKRIYQQLNLTQEDINEQFSGPAFLSWLRMGNLRGWSGPLSDAWHSRSLFLQKQILKRMRSLGIITILPAFAGHLPRAFKRLYPEVNMTQIEPWNDFNDTYCCPYFLDPTEKLFKTIGMYFIKEQISEFGTDHIYNCDSFNEVNPSTTDLTYLSNVGKSIYSAMEGADAKAIWLMQGWLFLHSFFFWTNQRAKALLTSVPVGKMVVLDLQSEQFPQYERLDQYYGQPYIWCMLHNFGGTLGMYGSANKINKDVIAARNANGSTMVGTGLTMEGINQNYVIYDLMAESAWRKEPCNLNHWFTNYTIRRYGKQNEDLVYAWKLLQKSVYNFNGLEKIKGQYAITKTPSLGIETWTWYEYTDLFQAWDYFIKAADDMKDSPGFLHDLLDVTRQVLQVHGDIYYNKLVSAFNERNNDEFQDVAAIFRSIFIHAESILATNEAFLLGPWLRDAKNCANNTEEEVLFEYNARNQITLWGPNGEIINYANKQWSGIMSDFFFARWTVFINAMNLTITEKVNFNQTLVKEQMFETVEKPFTFDKKQYPTEPEGNTVEVAKKIHEEVGIYMRYYNSKSKRSSKEATEDYYPYYLKKYQKQNNEPYITVIE